MPFSSGTFTRTFDCTTDRDNGVKILASKFDTEFDGIATGLSTCILKDGTQTCTAAIPFAEGLTVPDNKTIVLGTNSDITIQYDETTNDALEIAANVEGAALGVVLKADQGDDNADQHKLNIADGGVLTLQSKISGGFVTYLTHTPNATVTSSTTTVAGNLTVAGEVDGASLDISGDADIDGTLEADAMTLNGTAITATATLDTGISNNNVPKFTSGVADNDFLRVDGTAIEGRSASEVLSDIGALANLSEDSTPQLGGVLDANGNNIEFPDSSGAEVNRLKFGSADDLQIYHDTNNSYVEDSGTGYLILKGSDPGIALQNSSAANLLLTGTNDISLLFSGNTKLVTTNTGIDVTGTAVTDGLTSECAAGDSNLALTAYHPTSTSARTIAKFQSNVGSTQADKVTIGCDGKITIADGDLVIGTSGHGISFAATSDTSATGASMANELFDDYEEGTWTPTLGGNASYTGQAGRYTKIGRYVQADFDVTVNVLGTGSGGILQGLPFTVEASGGVFSGHVSFYSTLAANVTSLDCYAIANTDDIYFTGHGVASNNIGNNLTIFQNSARVVGTVHYFAA